MLEILKKILPVEVPSFAIPAYATEVAKNYLPEYLMIAQEVSTAVTGTILDIATGPGILPIETARLLPSSRIIGIDSNSQMIEIAKKNQKDYGSPNVEFIIMDAHTLAFADNSLDMIISSNALHHWRNPAVVLREIHRCLKPGSTAWIYDCFPDASNEAIDEYAARKGNVLRLRFFTRILLGLHGFSQKECDTTLKDLIASTPFKTGTFETRGIMFRLALRKQPDPYGSA